MAYAEDKLDFSRASWRKSSHSSNNGGACVELAAKGRLIGVRDSKDRNGPVLAFGRAGFGALVAGLRENPTRTG
ncbi:MAG: DUF397 domain-containing protein [Streptosporangiaceae bacterium]